MGTFEESLRFAIAVQYAVLALIGTVAAVPMPKHGTMPFAESSFKDYRRY